jgi:hypothetical protein
VRIPNVTCPSTPAQTINAALAQGRNLLIVDASPVNSTVLLSVGTPLPSAGTAADPDVIQDVFFGIGGAETTPVSAAVSLLDNASNSIIDDVWAWRADPRPSSPPIAPVCSSIMCSAYGSRDRAGLTR